MGCHSISQFVAMQSKIKHIFSQARCPVCKTFGASLVQEDVFGLPPLFAHKRAFACVLLAHTACARLCKLVFAFCGVYKRLCTRYVPLSSTRWHQRACVSSSGASQRTLTQRQRSANGPRQGMQYTSRLVAKDGEDVRVLQRK